MFLWININKTTNTLFIFTGYYLIDWELIFQWIGRGILQESKWDADYKTVLCLPHHPDVFTRLISEQSVRKAWQGLMDCLSGDGTIKIDVVYLYRGTLSNCLINVLPAGARLFLLVSMSPVSSTPKAPYKMYAFFFLCSSYGYSISWYGSMTGNKCHPKLPIFTQVGARTWIKDWNNRYFKEKQFLYISPTWLLAFSKRTLNVQRSIWHCVMMKKKFRLICKYQPAAFNLLCIV